MELNMSSVSKSGGKLTAFNPGGSRWSERGPSPLSETHANRRMIPFLQRKLKGFGSNGVVPAEILEE